MGYKTRRFYSINTTLDTPVSTAQWHAIMLDKYFIKFKMQEQLLNLTDAVKAGLDPTLSSLKIRKKTGSMQHGDRLAWAAIIKATADNPSITVYIDNARVIDYATSILAGNTEMVSNVEYAPTWQAGEHLFEIEVKNGYLQGIDMHRLPGDYWNGILRVMDDHPAEKGFYEDIKGFLNNLNVEYDLGGVILNRQPAGTSYTDETAFMAGVYSGYIADDTWSLNAYVSGRNDDSVQTNPAGIHVTLYNPATSNYREIHLRALNANSETPNYMYGVMRGLPFSGNRLDNYLTYYNRVDDSDPGYKQYVESLVFTVNANHVHSDVPDLYLTNSLTDKIRSTDYETLATKLLNRLYLVGGPAITSFNTPYITITAGIKEEIVRGAMFTDQFQKSESATVAYLVNIVVAPVADTSLTIMLNNNTLSTSASSTITLTGTNARVVTASLWLTVNKDITHNDISLVVAPDSADVHIYSAQIIGAKPG